jgi:hypothetical protein
LARVAFGAAGWYLAGRSVPSGGREARHVIGAPDNIPADRPALNPAAVSLADLARLLSAAGGQAVTVEMLEADVANGAPTNVDGTFNLVGYAAWLVREAASGGD